MGPELRVLLLEDDPADAELIVRELRRGGLDPATRCVASEVDYAVQLRDPGLRLILSDNALPGYDGLTALARARAERPEVPFIFVTGTLGEEAAIDALHRGATDYVLKQRLARLLPAVHRALAEVAERDRRRTAEDALRTSRRRLEAFFAGAPAGMALLDPELRYVLVNDALAMMNGLPAAAHPGKTLREVIPGFADDLEPLLRRVLDRGETVRGAELGGTSAASGGPARDWLASFFPVPGPGGEVGGVGAVVIGVTEMKRTLAALAESERRFRSLVGALEDSVLILDRDARVVGAWGTLPGADGAVGSRWSALGGGDGADLHRRALAQALAGETVLHEWTCDEAGGRRHVQTRLSPVRDQGGEVTGVVALGRDVTELRQIQAELVLSERMATVGLLAAGVVHEAAAPLAAIEASLDAATAALSPLRDRAVGPALDSLTGSLARTRDAVAQVRDLVRDLGAFSGAHEGDATELVALERVLGFAARIAGGEITGRARLVTDLQPTPPVRGSAARLGQVFLNLLLNATQAIPEGHAGENEIRIATRTGPGGRPIAEIADTGVGMTPAAVERLFSPYFTTRPAGVGSGLGLSFCHRIVAALGGGIEVESTPGRGATIRVVLPPAPPSSSEQPAPAGRPRDP